MNPTNDPLVAITEEDLAAILLSRKRRNLSDRHPVTCEEVGRLTPGGRLWYIAELVMLANGAKRGDPAASDRWRRLALAIATEVAGEAAAGGMADMLRCVADAIGGHHAEGGQKNTTNQKIMGWVNEYCRVHGKLPSQQSLKEFALIQGIKLRAADVSEVFASVQVRFPADKRGRKPSN